MAEIQRERQRIDVDSREPEDRLTDLSEQTSFYSRELFTSELSNCDVITIGIMAHGAAVRNLRENIRNT